MFQVLISFIYFLLISNAADIDREHALVLYDPELIQLNDTSAVSSISTFINFLESNFQVTYGDYDNEDITLFYDEEYSPRYENLILFPSSKKTIQNKKNLSQYNLVKFINSKSNVFVIGGGGNDGIDNSKIALPEPFKLFLNEIGIYPSPKNFQYIDNFNGNTLTNEENLIEKNNIVSELNLNSGYNGGAALISNNELISPIIKGSKTSFTNKLDSPIDQDTTWTFGEQGYLAVTMQALNNARVVWIGSIDLLSEENLYKWCFQKLGKLKLQFVQHINELNPLNLNPTMYRIKNQAVYTIGLSEYKDDQWVPFELQQNSSLIPQLSFKMLDPYQRLNLNPLGAVSSNESDSSQLDTFAYFVNFTVPDHHGMFTFELDYKRLGYSWLLDKKIVTVRHLANDEFKRSWDITNAWLYIASTVLVITAWFIFVICYIYVGKTNYRKKIQ